MADRDALELAVATHLATALTTIGHPRSPDAINATALDLIELCKGAFLNGVFWNPQQQAEYLVNEARTGWLEGWPERGGTAALYALYRTKFEPKSKGPVWSPLSYEETLAKGLIKPPCEACDDKFYLGEPPNMLYCLACAQGRANARWNGEEALHMLNRQRPKPKPAVALPTPAEIARTAADELYRKRKQLKELGLD